MMVVTKEDFFLRGDEFRSQIENGAVFVYPTDTIYGIGSNATNETAVLKLRNIKRQHDRPLSVIAPSVEWIKENCVITTEAEEWLKKLPGPYTLILKIKSEFSVAPSVTDTGSLGVRIPDNPISKFVELLGVPIITTSANMAGKMFMTSIEDLDPMIRGRIDFVVDAGDIKGRPSDIVFLDKDEIKIRERQQK